MENSQVKAKLVAPLSYAGGKGRIADLVWQYFGSPEIYIEPYAKQDAIWFSPYCLKPDTQSVTAKNAKKSVRNRKQTSTETVMPLLF